MILFWLFGVCLVLGGLALQKGASRRVAREIRAALDGLRLFLFGKPLRAPARRSMLAPDRPVALPSRPGLLPPPQVRTWPGGKPEFVVHRTPEGRPGGQRNVYG